MSLLRCAFWAEERGLARSMRILRRSINVKIEPYVTTSIDRRKIQADLTRVHISEKGVIKCTLEVSQKGDKDGSRMSCLGHKKNAINDIRTIGREADLGRKL